MKEASKYKYQQRIKELEARVAELKSYRDAAWQIYETVTTHVTEDKTTSMGWILKQFWRCMKGS